MKLSPTRIENVLLSLDFQKRGTIDLGIWWPAMCKEIASKVSQQLNDEGEEDSEHPCARKVLEHLNKLTGKDFRPIDSNLKPISARLREPGVIFEGVIAMIDRQCKKWLPDLAMKEYLRPGTLFRKSKFDGYYATRNDPVWDSTHPQRPKLRGE